MYETYRSFTDIQKNMNVYLSKENNNVKENLQMNILKKIEK